MQRQSGGAPPGNQMQAEETGVTCGASPKMSGILKRKFDEGPQPYLSLQGSEDDEVSCSDSGNSSDSLNNSVPSGIPDSNLQRQSKRIRGRNVHFESVTVYYFTRRQGFTSVPTQGGSTLGMSPRHSGVRRFTLREFALEQNRSHQNMLRDHLKKEKLNAIKLKLTKNGTVSSAEADTLTLDDISEDDLDVDNTEVDDYFFLQPLTTRRRRALLRASGVRRIDVDEKHELQALRMSREECGCRCQGICDPETCACSLAGIKCQVDRMSFPCGCTKDGCSNGAGRLEFNPVRVRTHFLHTIMKLELENGRQEPYPHPPERQQLVTNGNGYHGDPALIQQQQQPNLQSSLMMPNPVAQLSSAGDADLQLEEEEEEEDEDDEEEEDDYDEEEDEAYDDDDGSSVCSVLSDCSTHSLETFNPEEGEEDEEDEEDEDDDDDEEEEEEEDWDCSLDGMGPPPYPVPLPSVLSYSNSPLVGLAGSFHGAAPLQQYGNAPPFPAESTPILPSVESAFESDIKTGLLHTERPNPNTAPASTDLQNNPEHPDSQTEAGGPTKETREAPQPVAPSESV
ncbi:cysteine/serine-rich nuclear protein 3 [Oryzias melastigma]|uniref:Cysteine and serine rich nuclear protein 3 n=1 Tax=Oryzias melastigma TaxID=30732 RepID=A0A3B3B878_ORYME|nr:cysteine/serine-rich nuclear protein 3 [Oryzias melastigma]